MRDELAWLLGALEEVVDVETSEVFWDQSRAGYPRIIMQKCWNRYGRFVTIEEFDGRRRSSTILIPEGRFGQGWARFIVGLDRIRSSFREGRKLNEGREPRECKEAKVVIGRRHYVEVMWLSTQLEEECFHAYKEPIAKVSSWLKKASAELEKAKEKGKLPVTYAQAVDGGVWEKASTKSHIQPKSVCDSMERAGCDIGGERASAFTTQAKVLAGVACSLIPELPKRLKRAVNNEMSAFNAKQELCSIREWLGQLRGELDAGIERLDVVLNMLKSPWSG
jgi:hypothetical protein